MNILIVHNYYQIPGGEDSVVENEKRLLEEKGHRVILYTRNNSELKTMSKLRKLMLPITTIYNPRTASDIKRIIRENHIDVVHVHNTLNLISPAVYYAAVGCGVKVVQTVHNYRLLCPAATFYRDGHICEECLDKGLKCALKHKCYRGSRLQTLACVISLCVHRMTGIYGKLEYIALTEFNKEKLLSLKQISSDKVYIKPNFVDGGVGAKIEQDRDNQIIYVGRLERLKGVDKLLEAWEKLGDAAPKLIMCGTGELDEWCRKYIEKEKLNVELKGYVDNKTAKNLIAHSRALILPTQCYEGLPMTIVEAYSVGTPVIVPDMGNAGSIVVDGITGRKYRYNEIDSLVEIIQSGCYGDGKKAYQEYVDRYSKESNYKILMEIYNN